MKHYTSLASKVGIFSIIFVMAALWLSGSAGDARAGSYYAPDGTRPKDFTIVKSGDTWHLIGIHAYYSPAPEGPGSPGLIHSTSRDLINWQDIGAAIPVGPSGSWDSYDVWAPTLVKSGNTYHLWYAGVQIVNNQWVQKIGHATSTDLTAWTKDSGNPVFQCATQSWAYWDLNDPGGEGVDCRDPYVTRDTANNQWVMFFTARAQHINQDPLKYITHPSIIGMATSSDLVTWNDAGYIFTTGGYQAESPHAFEHNGTWWLVWTGNCSWRSNSCLKYATAPALTGPYSGYNDLVGAGADEYASEYFTDGAGTEYFGRVGWAGGWLDFDKLTWPNNVFTLSSTPGGTVMGRVWKDDNGDGLINNGESGVNDLSIDVYLDNGDDVFNDQMDQAFTGTTTGGVGANRGSFRVPIADWWDPQLPWATMWVRVNPDTLENGDPTLLGLDLTTPTVVKFVNPSNATLSGVNFGYNGLDDTAPATISDLH